MVFASRKGEEISSSKRPDRLWAHPASYSKGTRVKRPKREANYSPPSCAKLNILVTLARRVEPPASHIGDQCPMLEQIMRDLWWTVRQWDRLFFRVGLLKFLLPLFHQHIPSGVRTVAPLKVNVPRGVVSHDIKMEKKHISENWERYATENKQCTQVL